MRDDLEEYEESKWKTALWIALYALACGVLLAAFTLITSIIKFVCSLGALYLIIRFFKKYEKWSIRIPFIIGTLLFYFGSTIVVAMWIYLNEQMAAPVV